MEPGNFAPTAIALQFLLSSGYTSRAQVKAAIAAINNRLNLPDDHEVTLKAVQNEAQDVFGVLGMELVEVRDDYEEGAPYFAVVNREALSDAVNRLVMPTGHALQLKQLLGKFFRDGRCRGLDPTRLTATEFPAKQELLASLVNDRYIRQVEEADGPRIYPGTRLLYELEPYLREHFADRTLHKCLGCQQWLLQGRLCTNETCPGRLHDRCYDAYFSSSGAPPGICPLCSAGI